VLLGDFAIKPLVSFAGIQAVAGIEIGIDARVLVFALAHNLGNWTAVRRFPRLERGPARSNRHLKEGVRGSTTGSRGRMQSLLIVSETVLTVILLVSAGLLLRSFVKALNRTPDSTARTCLRSISPQPGSKAPTNGHRVRFVHDILQHIEQIPGVASAGMASSTPMNGIVGYGDLVSRDDRRQPGTISMQDSIPWPVISSRSSAFRSCAVAFSPRRTTTRRPQRS